MMTDHSDPGGVGHPDEARREINSAWYGIEHGWEIEPRAWFEEHARTMGFESPLQMAIHYMWKREPKPKFSQPVPPPGAVPAASQAERELAQIKKAAKSLRLDDLLDMMSGRRSESDLVRALQLFELVAALQIEIKQLKAAAAVPAAQDARPSRQLFIDLDGVLADFEGFYEQQFGLKLDRGIPNDPPGMWENIGGHGRFYADLPLMHDALALWEGAKRLHPNPIILTGIPHSIPNVEDHKREWVRRYISPDAKVVACKSKDKRNFGKPGDVLIDDWHRYRPLWEEMGGIFILHTSAANSLALAEGLFRTASHSDAHPSRQEPPHEQ